jgi:hypothetical protein
VPDQSSCAIQERWMRSCDARARVRALCTRFAFDDVRN